MVLLGIVVTTMQEHSTDDTVQYMLVQVKYEQKCNNAMEISLHCDIVILQICKLLAVKESECSEFSTWNSFTSDMIYV